MSAGPEYEHGPTQPGGPAQPGDPARPAKAGRRAGWPGSRRTAVLAGVVAFGLLAGAGVAYATTGSPTQSAASATAATPSSPASPGVQHTHRFPAGLGLPHNLPFRIGSILGGLGGALGQGGMFGAIHGQYVAAKPGGGYQTIDFQNGKVTAVSSTSITLRSADGYTHSYVVNGSTTVNAQRGGISSIKTGNQVSVQATVSGGTATAASIQDLSLLQKDIHHFFGNWPGKNAKQGTP